MDIAIIVRSAIVICCLLHNSCTYALTRAQKRAIGMQIWQNEASKKYDLLVFWNQRESFPSLGICHFIWFPAGQKISATQSFPEFIDYLQCRGVKLPAWLLRARKTGAPWKNRDEFLRQEHDARVQSLKKLLFNTIDLQVDFVIARLHNEWPDIYNHVSPAKKKIVATHFLNMTQTPRGMYALIDYLNFKGGGTNPREGYKGKGWGLLQVLEAMPSQVKQTDIVRQFVCAAKKVLGQRVANAPASKSHEKDWLPGWYNRIDTYLRFTAA